MTISQNNQITHTQSSHWFTIWKVQGRSRNWRNNLGKLLKTRITFYNTALAFSALILVFSARSMIRRLNTSFFRSNLSGGSCAREQLFTPITFAKKNFLLLHAKINTNVWDVARDT